MSLTQAICGSPPTNSAQKEPQIYQPHQQGPCLYSVSKNIHALKRLLRRYIAHQNHSGTRSRRPRPSIYQYQPTATYNHSNLASPSHIRAAAAKHIWHGTLPRRKVGYSVCLWLSTG